MNIFMRKFIGRWLGGAFLWFSVYAPNWANAEEKPFQAAYTNYQDLNHSIAITRIRAGNHDESGQNKYYFKASMYALRISKEDKKTVFAERQKIEKDLGMFGAVTLKSLSALPATTKGGELMVDGDMIRELISKAMRQFQVREDQIAIKIDIVMMRKSKKHYVLNDDRSIGIASYFPIPETLPHGVDKSDRTLDITDDLGTGVGIVIKFPINAKKSEAGGEPPPVQP